MARLAQTVAGNERQSAEERVRKWTDVLKGMAAGWLSIGSREPVSGAPAWVTLEVAHGGFATGSYLAGGPLNDAERKRADTLKLNTINDSRRALNLSYLTEEGLAELLSMLGSGCYRINVPEEAALMVVAVLVATGRVADAAELTATIQPWFPLLRFYSAPHSEALTDTTAVQVETVGEVIAKLKLIRNKTLIAAQNESLNIWGPMHDQFIELVVSSCEHPQAEEADSLGEPFSRCDDAWRIRALSLHMRYAEVRRVHSLCGKPDRRGEVFFEVRRLVRKFLDLAAGETLTERDKLQIRTLLTRDYVKRGAIVSARRQLLRAQQQRIGSMPTHAQAAQIAMSRLSRFDETRGIPEPEAILSTPLDDVEAARIFGDRASQRAGFVFAETIQRKVLRCLEGPIETLVERGLITSGDMLARLVPRIASRALGDQFQDVAIRNLYLQLYQAFRARRSLLLLNLNKQVQFEELPWVKPLLACASSSTACEVSSYRTFVDLVVLTLTAFPYAIIPNKLLQELRALSAATGRTIPLLDELAADIFMGKFSQKFGEAAKLAAEQLQGSLYAQYYEINTDHLLSVNFGKDHVAVGLAQICAHRARVKLGSWSPAANGCIIEQQQIITTHNLATLWSLPEVREQLEPRLPQMIQSTFRWLLSELVMRRRISTRS